MSQQSYIKKQEKYWIDNLTLYLKQLEKEQNTPNVSRLREITTTGAEKNEKEEMKHTRVSRRREIFKIMSEINAKETKESIAKINKAKSWFFEKFNKIDKPLDRLIKNKGRWIKSTKLEMKMEKSQQTTQKYKGP